MEFLPEAIDQYIHQHSQAEPELLARLNKETHLKVLQPRMLSGHLQGRVLSMIAHIQQPRRILEIGTYTGYSALCLAEGLSPGGHIDTIDSNEELRSMVLRYFAEAGLSERITLHTGLALEVLPSLSGPYDLVFIDADKENYLTYYQQVLPLMRSGALLLADNVLWSGKVIQPTQHANDEETLGILAFNRFVAADSSVQKVLLPVRDGLMLIRKK